MRSAWQINFQTLLLCGAVGVFACPQGSTAGQKIAFSEPARPLGAFETKQAERTPAKAIGGMGSDPADLTDFGPPPVQMIAPRKNTRQDLFSTADPNEADSKEGLLSPHLKGPSFQKGWTPGYSQDPLRGSQTSRDESDSNFRDSRPNPDDFRHAAGVDSAFPDRERTSDALQRGLDRFQKNPAGMLTQGKEFESMLHVQVPAVVVAPPDVVSPMHDSIWKNTEDRPPLSSHSSDYAPRVEQDSFSAGAAGRSHYSADDLGHSSLAPGYQSRSLSNPDQPNIHPQRSVFLPIPKNPNSVLR